MSRLVEANDLKQKVKGKEKTQAARSRGRATRENEQMNDIPKAVPIVRFGTFELNLYSRELRKQGMRLRMETKPFLILESLLEHAGEVITRQALCQKLWPDTHVGYEHSLNTAVNKLRNILCDLARSPRFVETLPRLGYRFIAPVQWPDEVPLGNRVNQVEMGHSETAKATRLFRKTKVTETLGQRSSRPQRVQEQPLQSKNCQTAP